MRSTAECERENSSIPTSLLQEPLGAQSAATHNEHARQAQEIRRVLEITAADGASPASSTTSWWTLFPGTTLLRGLMKSSTGCRGPATILAIERPSQIYVSRSRVIFLCVPGQPRPCSASEAEFEDALRLRRGLDVPDEQPGFVDAQVPGPRPLRLLTTYPQCTNKLKLR